MLQMHYMCDSGDTLMSAILNECVIGDILYHEGFNGTKWILNEKF